MTPKEKIPKQYSELASEIVLRAVRDYKSALKRNKKKPDNIDARYSIYECEQFFHSNWYQTLTDIDGDFLIRKVKAEVLK